MATYINYGEGEDDAVVQCAEWLREIITDPEVEEAFFKRFAEIHDPEARGGVDYGKVFDLFMEHSTDVFVSIPDIPGSRMEERIKEVESFFAVVFSVALLFDEQEQLDRAINQLCELFRGETTHSELRLRLQMMLYNTFNLPTCEAPCRMFKCIVDYAATAGLFDQVLPYLEYLDAWMADWDKHMKVEDKRALHRDISKYLRALDKRLDAFQFLKKYHVLFQGESAKVLAEASVSEMTVSLLQDAIQLHTVIQFDDLLNYDTVKALAATKKADLVNLCQVFLSGSVNDLRDFHGKNKNTFEAYSINYEDAMAKMRLLTLATIAHGRSEMSLKEIATALEEKEDNVEHWVVKAISEGVVDGRIDQLSSKLLVKSAYQRKFGKDEWAFLDSKLSQWIDNLENVIKFIGEQKQAREAA